MRREKKRRKRDTESKSGAEKGQTGGGGRETIRGEQREDMRKGGVIKR